MNLIKAKILDGTHLELSEPIIAEPGESILITIIDGEQTLWYEAAEKHFLEAYDDGDAIYDNL